jgi:hypothetical protein
MKFFIAGYGKFGKLALARLRDSFPDALLTVLEPRLEAGESRIDAYVEFVQVDAVSFLSASTEIAGSDWIIPMVPFHLAASLILAILPDAIAVPVPKPILTMVPNPYPVDQTCLCSSVADFLCPDSCSEGDFCSVTGEYRVPLCLRLKEIRIPDFTLGVLRSRQILPGVGGYQAADFNVLAEQVGQRNNIIATACRCHAVLTAIKRDTKS